MKKTIYFISVCLLLVSCSDFLKEKSTTEIFDGLYDNEAMLESDIYGLIAKFYKSSGLLGEGTEYLNMSSALIHHGLNQAAGNQKDYYLSCLNYTQYPTSVKNYSFWSWCYGIINASNTLIDNLVDSPVDADYKQEIEAEARFIRDYILFRVLKVWGDCPLKMEAPNMDNVCEGRDSYYKVYCAIVEDLEEWWPKMRSPQRVNELTPGMSRVNKYAGVALLSNIYTTIGSILTSPDDNFWNSAKEGRSPDFSSIGVSNALDAYRKALMYAEMLIPESDTHNPECTYRLSWKYGDLFNFDPAFHASTPVGSYDAYNNPERIFVLPITKRTYNSLATYTLPPYPEGTSYNADMTSSSVGRWRPNRFVFQHWCEQYPGEKGEGNAKNIYVSSSDPRLDITMYHTSIYNEKTKETTDIYPSANAVKTATASIALPYFKKYWSRGFAGDYGEADAYLIRLAEMYFNAAEAAAEIGEYDKVYKYMEVIHARARRSVPEGEPEAESPKWSTGDYSTIDEYRTAIFWERIYELYGEGHEWDETHRHGAQWLIDNVSIPKNDFLKLPEQAKFFSSGYLYPRTYSAGFEYVTDVETARKGLLYGYPNNEIAYNTSLSQINQNDYFYDF